MVKGGFSSDSGNCGKPADARVSRGSGVLVAACRMDADALPNLSGILFPLVYSGFRHFLICFTYSLTLLSPLFPGVPHLSVVKHVVKNRFLNTLVTGDRKRFLIVCRSAADGCFVAPVCRIVPLLERLSKSFMQGQAAQNLHRYRQRIHSRICPLKIKLTLQKYYFGLNLVSPQKLLHSHNLSGILRESMFEIRESTCS